MRLFHKSVMALCLIAVLLLSASPVVFAAGSDDSTSQDTDFVFSYWNIDNIYATTRDNRQLVFEFPSDFFYKPQISDQVVTIRSTDGQHSLDLHFYGTDIDGQKYMLIDIAYDQEDRYYTQMSITWLNNVIYPNNALIPDYTNSMSWHVPYFWFWNTSTGADVTDSVVDGFASTYSVVMPNPRDDGSVGFDTSKGSYGQLSSTTIDYQKYYNLLIPQETLDNVVSSFGSKGYADHDIALYFDHCNTTFLINYYESMGTTLTFFLPVGECDAQAGYLIGSTRVSLWYDKYGNFDPFPTYPESELDYGLEGITDFVGIVFHKLFEIEIFPGIYIGGIMFAIMGILFVRAAINFFAGG